MWRLLKQIWIKTNICDRRVTVDQSGADKML